MVCNFVLCDSTWSNDVGAIITLGFGSLSDHSWEQNMSSKQGRNIINDNLQTYVRTYNYGEHFDFISKECVDSTLLASHTCSGKYSVNPQLGLEKLNRQLYEVSHRYKGMLLN